MGIPRRQFLKGLWQSLQVSALGSFGVAVPRPWPQRSEAAWADQAQAYPQRLTASLGKNAGRKLAVLVGINNYANGPLRGCVTDVALQEQLLRHRFGFAASDIVTLTDGAATASNISQTVTEHLIAQALPDDLVVFHFSGYGTHCNGLDALLPVDETELLTMDLVQHWLRAMAADQVLCVIDAGFYYPAGAELASNMLIRARPSHSQMDISFSNQAIDALSGVDSNLSSTSLPKSSAGLLIAAGADQLCRDITAAGFSCGAFTYALSQSLWHTLSPVTDRQLQHDLGHRLVDLGDSLPVVQWLDQEQAVQGKLANSQLKTERILPLIPQGGTANAGVILGDTKNRDTFDLWLIGLPIHILGYYDSGSILRVSHPQNNAIAKSSNLSPASSNTSLADLEAFGSNDSWLGLQSRHGLVGKVEMLNPAPEIALGNLVQEQIRVLPRQIALYVSLDNSLNKIERIDATSALSAQPNLGPLLQPHNPASEQLADCIFSLQEISYGILAINRQPLVGSFGAVGESVGVAIKRLSVSFAELLAAKLLRLTANAQASQLSVQASLYTLSTQIKSESAKSVKSLAYRRCISSCKTQKFVSTPFNPEQIPGSPHLSLASVEPPPLNLPVNSLVNLGDRLECRIDNHEDVPLYAELFYIDSRGRLLNRTATNQNLNNPYSQRIPPRQSLVLPQAPFNWAVTAPKGLVEVLIIVSRDPFTNGRAVLANDLNINNNSSNTIYPLDVAEGVLLDLHQQSLAHQQHLPNSVIKKIHNYLPLEEHHWIWDMHQWATLSLSYWVT